MPWETWSVRLADLNLDGNLDAAAASPAYRAVFTSFGDGTGAFSLASVLAVGPDPEEVRVADLDGDGIPDLVTANGASNVSALLNDGTGGFFPATRYGSGDESFGLDAGDLDSDGLADVVTADFGGGTASELIDLASSPGTWTNLGNGLAGTSGVPSLTGTGVLTGGTPLTLALVSARPSAPAWLLFGICPLYKPFAGGVMVPDFITPPGLFLPLVTSGTGTITINSTWPVGIPPGFAIFTQFWIADPVAIFGRAASNAVRAVTP